MSYLAPEETHPSSASGHMYDRYRSPRHIDDRSCCVSRIGAYAPDVHFVVTVGGNPMRYSAARVNANAPGGRDAINGR